jgi:hypothetical protein
MSTLSKVDASTAKLGGEPRVPRTQRSIWGLPIRWPAALRLLSFDLAWAKLLDPVPDTLQVRIIDYVGLPGGSKREATLEFNLPDVFVADTYFFGRAGRIELDFSNLFDDVSNEPFTQIEDVWVELGPIAESFGPPMNTFAIDNVSINHAIGPTGDYNRNGVVDAADYVVWRKNMNTTNALPNDLIGGTIGPAHYDQWRAHFGQTAGTGSSTVANAAVPEPSTLVMLVLAAVGVCSRRRRAA